MIANDVDEGISRLGITGGIGAIQANKAREKLNERKIQLMALQARDDGKRPMLKKDPLVKVIDTQTNSPGATHGRQADWVRFLAVSFQPNSQRASRRSRSTAR